jgi:prevent-host-death family protein
MADIGVRELREHTSRVLKRVREKGEEISITYRGQVVARLIPVIAPKSKEKETSAVWADLDHLAAEIGSRWPKDVSATESVREGRRRL